MDIIKKHYIERFSRLPEAVQSAIIDGIDRGLDVVSTFDLADGTTSCILTCDPRLSLWEEAIARPEMASLALEAQTQLNKFNVDQLRIIDQALQTGTRLLALVQHNAPGGFQLLLYKDGMTVTLATMLPEKTVH